LYRWGNMAVVELGLRPGIGANGFGLGGLVSNRADACRRIGTWGRIGYPIGEFY
jgi:hypothetical protein